MYGAVPPPPARTRAAGAGIVAVRVLLMVAPLLSIGLLVFAPLLRIALLRRRWYDWTLVAASLPVATALFAVVGTLPQDAVATNVSLSGLLVMAFASAVYFLVFDLRHQERLRAGRPQAPAPPRGQAGPGPAPGYGYPPYATTPVAPVPPVPGAVPYVPPPFASQAFPPPPASPPPAARPPAPATARTPRIEQVRAELDELSDLLRGARGTDKDPGSR